MVTTTDPGDLRGARPTTRRPRLRERSMMLNPALVIAAALAAFALVLGGLTLRLANGHDPGLAGTAAISARPSGVGTTSLTTRTSGALAPGVARTGAHGSSPTAPLLTAASGVARGAGGGDA